MILTNKKIGIWGFGVTGKSVLHFLQTLAAPGVAPKERSLGILEKKQLMPEEQALFALHNATLHIGPPEPFLDYYDLIIPSPGIDLRPYTNYQHKWLSELDLFQTFWKKPIIALSGSVGKTTTTHLLSHILKALAKRVATGGNIGIGCLDLIAQQDVVDLAVLEVSSFQLEHAQLFAPTLAVITNLLENHLDRHGSLQLYAQAKLKMIYNQQPKDQALIAWDMRKWMDHGSKKASFVSKKKPSAEQLLELTPDQKLFYIDNEVIFVFENNQKKELIKLVDLPDITYPENILILTALLFLLDLPLDSFASILQQQEIPEHRLEKVATINNITFYNDSKATIPLSTLAALEKFHDKPIILFLGGISKGVNRSAFVKDLCGKVKHVICFGKEAHQLKQWCDENRIPSSESETLENAFAHGVSLAQPGDCVLLSPAGASYDLFTDYKERGTVFKGLVKTLLS